MTIDGRRRDDLLEQALDLDQPSRDAFLHEMCGADTELRAVLERLLALDRENGGDFLDPEADPVGADLARGTNVDRYVLDEKIGVGGMGAVYRAYDPRLGRHVALKLLKPLRSSPTVQQRFLHEARALGGLLHDGIVRVYDAGEYDGSPYLVTELLEGEDLAQAIKAGHVGDRARQLAILTAVAEALSAVHAAGFVHRDVKPSNVFLTAQGGVKLLDFGIARPLRRAVSAGTIVVGTPLYMSPEQMLGQPATPASDVYGFGILAFEVLTGERYARDKLAALEAASRSAANAGSAEPLSPALIGLLRRSTFEDRTGRIQSFAEVLSLLRSAEQRAGTDAWWRYPVTALAIVAVVTLALLARRDVAPTPATSPVSQAQVPAGGAVSVVLVIDGGADGERRVPLSSTPLVLQQSTRFRLQVSSESDGYVYVFARPRDGSDLHVLFPSPTSYAGSSRLETSSALEIPEESWLQFGQTPGSERLWLVWSRRKQQQFEDAIKWANERDRGVIGSDALRDQIAARLEREQHPLIPDAGRLYANADGDMLVGVVDITHQ